MTFRTALHITDALADAALRQLDGCDWTIRTASRDADDDTDRIVVEVTGTSPDGWTLEMTARAFPVAPAPEHFAPELFTVAPGRFWCGAPITGRGAYPRTCARLAGHDGEHTSREFLGDLTGAASAALEKFGAGIAPDGPWNAIQTTTVADAVPVRLVLPGRPETGRTVRDVAGKLWRCLPDGELESLPGDEEEGPGWSVTIGWLALLLRGPVDLLPLTPAEEADAALYGPPGARWGDPATPCPYSAGYAVCALGVGHIGPHKDADGNALGLTDVDEDQGVTTARVDVEDTETPCTCGHPEAHTPDCARFPRRSGGAA